MEEDLPLLLQLSKKTELHNRIIVSTTHLAEELHISQQTVSRKLRELEEKGWISRTASLQGTTIQISEKGKKLLDETYMHLKNVFERQPSAQRFVKGKVFDGIGEGKFYMQQEGYVQQFVEKLHFKPYPGTLNIHVESQELQRLIAIKPHIFIDTFTTHERTFGGIHCYQVIINNTLSGALIVPVRTHHPEHVAELIAPVALREYFQLHNDDEVTIT